MYFYIGVKNTVYTNFLLRLAYSGVNNRDETIWRYIDTVSIRRLTIRIVAQRDISRFDLDINFVIRRSHHVVFIFVFDEFFRIRSRYIFSVGVAV